MNAGNQDYGFQNAGGRNFANLDDQGAPQHTMMGLGPIAQPASRRSSEDCGRDFAQHTIAGMPGISFNPGAKIGEANAMRGGWDDDAAMRQENAIQQAELAIQKSQQEIDNRISKAPEAPENALAGFPNVNVVPSSLVDEEFDDLTSKLFGADFVVASEPDDDDDELDFDFPTTPVAKETAKPNTNAKLDAKHPAPVKSSTNAKPVESNTKPAAEETGSVKPASSLNDKIAIGATCLGDVVILGWIAQVLTSAENAMPVVAVAGLTILGSLICVGLKKSLKSGHIVAIMGILACALFVAMIAFSAPSATLLLVGILCQLICVGACFLKN